MDKFYKNCDCNDWKDNCGILDSAIIMGLTHGMKGLKKSFSYCPWCGELLKLDVNVGGERIMAGCGKKIMVKDGKSNPNI